MYSWRECLGSDLNLRADLIKRIESKRAFWILPDAEDLLFVYGAEDPLLVRDLGGGIIEWILSEDQALNRAALKAWPEIDMDKEASEFFSVVENPEWLDIEIAKESIGMAEAEPDEISAGHEMEADVMAVLLLINRNVWPRRKAHAGYPAPMKAWTYRL